MKIRFSKAMQLRVGQLTNNLFKDAISEVTGIKADSDDNDELYAMMDLMRHAKEYSQVHNDEEIQEMIMAKEAVDTLYLTKMIKLGSKQLEEIIAVHNHGTITRAPRTIEAIISELTRRMLLNDTCESDNTDNNGDVCALKKQSKRSCKKVATKRRKTSKN